MAPEAGEVGIGAVLVAKRRLRAWRSLRGVSLYVFPDLLRPGAGVAPANLFLSFICCALIPCGVVGPFSLLPPPGIALLFEVPGVLMRLLVLRIPWAGVRFVGEVGCIVGVCTSTRFCAAALSCRWTGVMLSGTSSRYCVRGSALRPSWCNYVYLLLLLDTHTVVCLSYQLKRRNNLGSVCDINHFRIAWSHARTFSFCHCRVWRTLLDQKVWLWSGASIHFIVCRCIVVGSDIDLILFVAKSKRDLNNALLVPLPSHPCNDFIEPCQGHLNIFHW